MPRRAPAPACDRPSDDFGRGRTVHARGVAPREQTHAERAAVDHPQSWRAAVGRSSPQPAIGEGIVPEGCTESNNPVIPREGQLGHIIARDADKAHLARGLEQRNPSSVSSTACASGTRPPRGSGSDPIVGLQAARLASTAATVVARSYLGPAGDSPPLSPRSLCPEHGPLSAPARCAPRSTPCRREAPYQ